MEASGDPPRIIIPVFLLGNWGRETDIGYITQYQYPSFESIRPLKGENNKLVKNLPEDQINALQSVEITSRNIMYPMSDYYRTIDTLNICILDYIKKEVIHRSDVDFGTRQTFRDKQPFNVFVFDTEHELNDYHEKFIGILFYKTQTKTHNIYFVYCKTYYKIPKIYNNWNDDEDSSKKVRQPIPQKIEVKFLCYLVRCDNFGIFRLPGKNYSTEDAKKDLLEQIPIFYRKLRKISPELLPTNNKNRNTNVNPAFINASFGINIR
jgi:hypothetical protein